MKIQRISITSPADKLEPSPADLTSAATMISLLLSTAEVEVGRIIENINANIDKTELLATLHNYLSDLNGDLIGPINDAAEEMRSELYAGVSTRGPFYRMRP